MIASEIIAKAKERLAEIEKEAAQLRSIIAVGEGKPIEVAPPPPPVFIPYPVPQPSAPSFPHYPDIPWPGDGVTFTTCQVQDLTVYG